MEIEMFYKMDHMHVVKYVGLCQATRSQMDWAIFEHSEAGDLWHFVRQHSERITHNMLTDFANQVAQGMLHISEHRYVHRDLAARNCIVHLTASGQPVIKVSILNICREGQFDGDYFLLRNQLMPLRWMPAEAAFDDEFSVKSDVWSFGVVCFELLTYCKVLPYLEYSDQEVARFLETGTLELSLQVIGSKRGINVIKQCVEKNPKDRPTFNQILALWQLAVPLTEDGQNRNEY